MKRIVSILLLIACLFALASCGGGNEVPEGMQLANGSDAIGYYFFVPEEWVVSNYGDYSAAYASLLDSSSVSYTEIAPPEGSFSEYFDESLSEFVTAPTVVTRGEKVTFGNADSAEKFVYDHTYAEHSFRTMQIFARFDGRFGIFTYTSFLEKKNSDVTQYEFYMEKVQGILDNFKFVKIQGESEGNDSASYPEYDGYYLVSDKSVSKFSLYLPSGFEVVNSSGSVLATLDDGSNIMMSRATATGTVFADYYSNRKSELSAITKNFTEIKKDQSITFANASAAFLYEYTYELGGETYHVYQVLSKTTFDGFVFTYTAKEQNYEKHLSVIEEIMGRVEL